LATKDCRINTIAICDRPANIVARRAERYFTSGNTRAARGRNSVQVKNHFPRVNGRWVFAARLHSIEGCAYSTIFSNQYFINYCENYKMDIGLSLVFYLLTSVIPTILGHPVLWLLYELREISVLLCKYISDIYGNVYGFFKKLHW